MAKNTATATKDTEDAPTRTAPIDVAGQDARGFAAAYPGLYHLFGARVESWDVSPDGLVAKNVTFDAAANPERIIRDINRKDRRAPLFPAVLFILDPKAEPPNFANALELTTYMVNFWKGSMGPNSSKVPEYVRIAAGEYKERTGTKVRKGPKVRTINLKNVREVNVETLKNAGMGVEDIDYLIKIATELRNTQNAPAASAEETPATETAEIKS